MLRLVHARADHGTAQVVWGDRGILGVGYPLEPPVACHPFNLVGDLHYADGEGHAISPGSFGTVTRLLVANGTTVTPGQAILEFDERPPTLEEWREQHDMTWLLRERIQDLERHLENPWHAWWASLRGLHRKVAKPIPVWGNNPEAMRAIHEPDIQ